MKLTGLIMIMFFGIMCGQVLSQNELKKISNMQKILHLTQNIESSVSFSNQTLYDLIQRDNSILSLKILACLRQNLAVKDSVFTAIHSCKMTLLPEFETVLSDFFDTYGATSRDDQLNACRYAISRMEHILNSTEKQLRDKSAMYQKLVPICTCAFVILLI